MMEMIEVRTSELRARMEEAFRRAREGVYGDEQSLLEKTRRDLKIRTFVACEQVEEETQIRAILMVKAAPSLTLYHNGIGQGLEIVTLMVIDPLQHSNKGLGRCMLDQCLRIAGSLRLGAMFVPVHVNLSMLQGFFRRHGFFKVCQEEFDGSGEHDWMACMINDPAPIRVTPREFRHLNSGHRDWAICKYNVYTSGVRIGDQVKVYVDDCTFHASVIDVRFHSNAACLVKDIGPENLFPDEDGIDESQARALVDGLYRVAEDGFMSLRLSRVETQRDIRVPDWIQELCARCSIIAPPYSRLLDTRSRNRNGVGEYPRHRRPLQYGVMPNENSRRDWTHRHERTGAPRFSPKDTFSPRKDRDDPPNNWAQDRDQDSHQDPLESHRDRDRSEPQDDS